MERRSFLGLMIGTLAGAPFVAEAAPRARKIPRLEKIKRWVRAFELPQSQLRKFRAICKTPEGEFWAPSLDTAAVREDELKLTLSFATVDLTRAVSVHGVRIVDDQGFTIADTPYRDGRGNPTTVHMVAGDKLVTNYTITLGPVSE